jgi:hypothetical protein
LDKPHILAKAAETSFLLFKEQVPLKFKKEISAVQCERKTFQLISLSTPVSFRWTVPLSTRKYALKVGMNVPDRLITLTPKVTKIY